MMVAPVPAFTAVDFCQFNPAAFNAIDGSDVYAIGADNLHMLFYRGSGIQVSLAAVSRPGAWRFCGIEGALSFRLPFAG